jgi:hypothetical protein
MMLNFCGIVVAILKMAIGRNFSSPISTTFHMWVDYDGLNLFPTLNKF